MGTQVASTGLSAQSAAQGALWWAGAMTIPAWMVETEWPRHWPGASARRCRCHGATGPGAVGSAETRFGWFATAGTCAHRNPVAVPATIAGDSRRRMVYKIGVHAARQLALAVGELSTEDLLTLGRQTVADHLLSGNPGDVLVSLARSEGALDETAWAAGNKDKIVEQVSAFLSSAFKEELDLYDAVQELAAEPPCSVAGSWPTNSCASRISIPTHCLTRATRCTARRVWLPSHSR